VTQRDLQPLQAARYARQILLAEIGRAGQARICEATAPVAGQAFVHQVAQRYADRVGFSTSCPGHIPVEQSAPSELLQEPAARAVLAASRAVLAAMRTAAAQETK